MSSPTPARFVAVRLEGGLGDHILGMRVLSFVRAKYPSHEIVVFADCAGDETQLQVVALSPLVARVVPIYRRASPMDALPRWHFAQLTPHSLALMRDADVIIDAHGDLMMIDAAKILNVGVYDILHTRPRLTISSADLERADHILTPVGPGAVFVGLNLSKYGEEFLNRHRALFERVIERLLRRPDVIILNVFRTHYGFTHWPEPIRGERRQAALGDAAFQRSLCRLDRRVVPCVDMPIAVIAALLSKCRYFLGVDNGIKHLAWALNTPLTFFQPARPTTAQVFRWMPDVHRLLMFSCSDDELNHHLAPEGLAIRDR